MYIGIDGTGVPMLGGGTRESKTGIIYQTRERAGKTEVINQEYRALGDQSMTRPKRCAG